MHTCIHKYIRTLATTKPGNAWTELARKHHKHHKLLFTQSYPDPVLSTAVRHCKSNFPVCNAVAYFPLTHSCTCDCCACTRMLWCIYSQRYLLHFDRNFAENASSVFQCLRSSAAFENPSYPVTSFVPLPPVSSCWPVLCRGCVSNSVKLKNWQHSNCLRYPPSETGAQPHPALQWGQPWTIWFVCGVQQKFAVAFCWLELNEVERVE